MALNEGLPFSRRAAFTQQPNALSRLRRRLQDDGVEVIDLSASNPSRCHLGVDPQRLLSLSDPAGVHYRPLPFGSSAARAAVARYYHRRGFEVDADAILLTASTSDAYSYLFKLLCDPYDELLIPQPSYPLFPYLARLEGVHTVTYPAIPQEGFRIDLAAVARLLEKRPRIRVMIVVHPNNPTGAMLRPDDAAALLALLARHGVALIVDEVFADYVVDGHVSGTHLFEGHVLDGSAGGGRRRGFAGEQGCLCFVLSGLSKVALLPQAKLAWLLASGPAELLRAALQRLEVIADCYLSVSTAAQLAAPAWLDGVDELQQVLRDRLTDNRRALDAALRAQGPSCPLRRLPADGGWYTLVEVPRTRSDEAWCLLLLQQERLSVQPGYFYDIDEAGVMVVSLLLPPVVFAEAIGRAVRCWSAG